MKKLLIFFFTILSLTPLMGNDISWSFPPTALSNASVNSSDPHIAMDSSGNVVAVWVENGFVKSNTKLVSSGWGTTATLSGSGGSFPRVAVAPSGNAAAVWVEGGVVKGASKTFGGSWSSVTNLSTAGGASPDVAADVAGDFVAAWVRSGSVESSTKLSGGAWQTHVTITSTSAASPQVAIGGSGAQTRAVIVWHGTVSGTTNAYAATKLISGSWSAQTAISNAAHNAQFADVAVDANGNAVAVWYQYDLVGSLYSNVIVQSASRLASGNWTPSVGLSAPGVRNPANLAARVGFDAYGNAMAVWNTSFDGETFNIQSAVLPVRGNWTAPIELLKSVYSYQASMAVSSLGDVLATYMFYNGVALQIQSSEADISGFTGNVWSVPLTVSSGTQNGYSHVAATLTGNIINAATVWVTQSGAHTVIQASTGQRTVVLPPSALSVVQTTNNVGVFTEYYNTLSWTASSDPGVVGYLIYRNGMFLEQVDASVLSIVDHNMVQTGAVTYGVSAVNVQQSHSAIVNVNYP
jgi:hypothetical protein